MPRVGPVLEDDAEGFFDDVGIEMVAVKGYQGLGPVEGFGYPGWLLEPLLAHLGHKAADLLGEDPIDAGDLGPNDGQLLIEVGIVDPQIKAPSPDGV